ncbi:MAG: MmgE/PrpD family protein [Ardenticatenaceae bacterium]|nr:MmgE/PrpD family protein [Ardenticatenaceae bacterium]HBY95157.1 hypothetical protein [Chloroflexota bacterium]
MNTDEICSFVEKFRLADASSYAREQAILHIIDTIGVALAASSDPATQIALRQVEPKPRGAVAWGQEQHYATGDAAWVNGIAAHAFDFDDTSMLSGAHLSAGIVPAVIALGEQLGVPGAAILEAYIVGHEVAEKVGATLPSMESYARGWHGTAVHAEIGSAAGAAKLLGLQGPALAQAFGIAASLASGIRRNTGSMTTALHSGNAASNGIIAASLARDGFTANPAIFDGPASFFDAFCWRGEPGAPIALVPLGRPLGFEDPGVGIKPYPMGSPLFSVAEGMLAWKHELGFRPEDLVSVKCALHPNAYEVEGVATTRAPQNAMQAKYSVPYVVAAISVFGALGLEQFSETALADPEVNRIIPLVEVGQLEGTSWTSGVGQEVEPPTRLELRLQGRAPLVKMVNKVRGYPGGGLFTVEETRRKFFDCVRRIWPRDRAEAALETLLGIEKIGQWRKEAELLQRG